MEASIIMKFVSREKKSICFKCAQFGVKLGKPCPNCGARSKLSKNRRNQLYRLQKQEDRLQQSLD